LRSFELSDVHGKIAGIQHGVGFVLFIREGKLGSLEGSTYADPWPAQVESFELKYLFATVQSPTWTSFAECEERDLAALTKTCMGQ